MAEIRVIAVAAGKRERTKQANRGAILAAAQRCFLEHGYEAITVRDIIRHTELASGTFYNYFPDKETLFRALVEERIQALTQHLVAVRRSARTLQDFVHGAYLAAFTAVLDDPVFYNLLLRNEPVVRAFFKDSLMGLSVEALKADLTDAIRRGILPKMDVEYLAAAFFGAGYEMGRVLAEHGRRHNPEQAAEFATRLFLGGIQAFANPKIETLKPRLRAAPA